MAYEAYDKTGEIKGGKVVLLVRRGGAEGFPMASYIDQIARRYVDLLNSEAWHNGNGVTAREVDKIRAELIRVADLRESA